MRRMLEAKKQEVTSDVSHSMDYAQIAEKSAEDRKRIREEKQRQARQQAIQVRLLLNCSPDKPFPGWLVMPSPAERTECQTTGLQTNKHTIWNFEYGSLEMKDFLADSNAPRNHSLDAKESFSCQMLFSLDLTFID